MISTPAFAAPSADEEATARAKALFQKAQTAYDVGEFDRALDLFTEAYKAKNLAAILFNIAQCHRQKGGYERAAFFFQRFIDKADPKAANLDLARELLEEMKKKRDAAPVAARPVDEIKKAPEFNSFEAPKPEPVKPEPAKPPVVAAAPKDVPAPASTTPVAVAPSNSMGSMPVHAVSAEAEDPVYKKWWFWTAIGGGAAVAAGATVAIVVLASPKAVTPSLGTINGRN